MNNKIFKCGVNIFSNACVGNNGASQTYMNYAQGYKKSFEHSYKCLIENQYTNIDSAIFPLVFLARQSIELYLKNLLYNLEDIWENGNKKQTKTHGLLNIWEKVKPILKAKPRIFEVSNIDIIESFINEFDSVDKTGEVFRYPESNDGIQQLQSLSVINVDIFYKEISNFLEIIEKFLNKAYFYKENLHKQHTTNLTFDDIEDIVEMLPFFPWDNKSNIEDSKKAIIKKYNISQQELSNAINIIKTNRKHSGNLGKPIQLEFINLSKLSDLINLSFEYRKIYDSKFSNRTSILFASEEYDLIINDKLLNTIDKKILLFLEKLSKEELRDVAKLVNIGLGHVDGEMYKESFNEFGVCEEYLARWLHEKKLLGTYLIKALHKLGLLCLLQ